MKVLVIGNGGREDALCHKLSQSPLLEKLYCSKGNAGTRRYAENVDLSSFKEIYDFAMQHVDLVVVGPENPLCEGIVDLFEGTKVKVFGPNKKAAQLEGSKDFSKQFLEKYHLPTARYQTVTSLEEGKRALKDFDYPIVIKADGLCAGKGVGIFQEERQAIHYLEELFIDRIFKEEANKVVIEEYLEGKEASLLCIVSGNQLFPLESARDYKRIYDGDQGDNTGGVGCYSPNELFDDRLKENLQGILEGISFGLKKEGLEYSGVLFIGFMIQNHQAKILEFNVRFGDPETEVVLPRLESDLLRIILKSLDHTLTTEDFKWSKNCCMTVILTSQGYPHAYEKHKEIQINLTDPSLILYHNNTKYEEGKVYSDGGRVLALTALEEDYESCRKKIYDHLEEIQFENKQYRKDIGIISKK